MKNNNKNTPPFIYGYFPIYHVPPSHMHIHQINDEPALKNLGEICYITISFHLISLNSTPSQTWLVVF
jgi:hypothetical protein